MFSYLLDNLNTQGAHALLDRTLREVNDNPDSRFCTLKKRLREHFELLQKEEFGHEKLQYMVDILGTDSNYEEKLKRAVAGSTEESRWSRWLDYIPPLPFISNKRPKTTPNGYQLVQEDDATFLAEICTMRTDKPAYQRIVEEILQEATNCLGIKLKRLEGDMLHLVRSHVSRIVKQGIDDRVNTEKRDADQAAYARLRSLIREALDAEVEHPTNWWVFTTSYMCSNSRALDHIQSDRTIIRGVSVDKSGSQGCVFDGNRFFYETNIF